MKEKKTNNMTRRLRDLGILEDAKAGLLKCVPTRLGAGFKLQVRNIRTGVIYDL